MTMDANDIARARGVDALRAEWDKAEVIHLADMNDASVAAINLQEIDGPRPRGAFLVAVRASDVAPTKIDWLWPDRFARGKVSVLAGEGGLGKSLLLMWLTATVSRAAVWPCLEGVAPRGSVLILSAEDDTSDTLIPRLLAAGADTTRVHIIRAVKGDDGKGNRTFNLQRDLPALEAKIAEVGDVLAVIIDPVTSYLGAVDSHRNAELRQVLEPLGELASRLRVAVICNTHLSKGGGSANNRIIGSVAFVNHARAAFIVTADPDNKERRLFLPSKTNLGRLRDGLAYRVGTRFVGENSDIPAPVIEWEDEPVKISADDAVAAATAGGEKTDALGEAKDFLNDVLAAGPIPPDQVEQEAKKAGLSWATVRRAKTALKVKSSKTGMEGGWVWILEGAQK